MARPTPRRDAAQRRFQQITTGAAILLGGFLLYALVVTFASPREAVFDDTLPNPMGGPAREAPGEATGSVELAGLVVTGAQVDMGDVPLGVTVVPAWRVRNPTDTEVAFAAGQPQVLEGCCPGPVYADGQQVAPGAEIRVPPGGEVLVQFPLQMHPGMDGPHHLAVPLLSGDVQQAVHVTGNFTADA